MTFLRRMWGALRGGRGADARQDPSKSSAPEADAPPAPAWTGVPPPPTEEAYLRAILDRLHVPDAPASRFDDAFWGAIDRLVAAGRHRTAIDLLRRFFAARPDAFAVAARAADLLCDRLEHAEARPLLERLLASPEHASRARFLLAEACERQGDLDGARRHYELLLARDIDYPKARARHAALGGDDRGTRDVEPAAPTVFGVDGGAAVSGRYRLRRELGRGGLGAVYLALDEELGREVALKLLHPHGVGGAATRARSFSEARIAAALRHPGVVAIYDLDEERRLIAMELCSGTLRERIAQGPVPASEALARARELFATLEAVHRAGVVHRDLKPGNLLFRPSPLDLEPPELVLGDFGLAHLQGAQTSTGEDGPAGTPGYMAPEARLGHFSPASDVYAAGVILFTMLTGDLPFDRAAIFRGDARWAGPLPERARAALGGDAEAVTALLARMLDVDPAARPDAAGTLRALSSLPRA